MGASSATLTSIILSLSQIYYQLNDVVGSVFIFTTAAQRLSVCLFVIDAFKNATAKGRQSARQNRVARCRVALWKKRCPLNVNSMLFRNQPASFITD